MPKFSHLLIAVAAWSSCAAFGQALTIDPADTSYQRFRTTVVGNGVGLGQTSLSPAALARTTITSASDGTLLVRTPSSIPLSPALDATVSASVSRAAAAKAIGQAIFRLGSKILLGVAIVDFLTDIGAILTTDASGKKVISASTLEAACAPFGVVPTAIQLSTDGSVGGGYCYNQGGVVSLGSGINRGNYVCYKFATCASGNTLLYDQSDWLYPNATAPLTEQQFVDRVAAKSGWPSDRLVPFVQDAVALGADVPATPSVITGPATKVISQETTANPDGTKTTSTVTNNYTYQGANVNVSTTTSSVVTNAAGAVLSTTTTTKDAAPAVQPKDLEVCGLPGKPKCAIDETGTPTADPAIDGQKVADAAMAKLKTFGADPVASLPALPSLNWAFRLPTGCVPLQITAFAPFLQTIDICQFQPMFHDIMAMVWTIGGLFGAIGLFWRNTLSQN